MPVVSTGYSFHQCFFLHSKYLVLQQDDAAGAGFSLPLSCAIQYSNEITQATKLQLQVRRVFYLGKSSKNLTAACKSRLRRIGGKLFKNTEP